MKWLAVKVSLALDQPCAVNAANINTFAASCFVIMRHITPKVGKNKTARHFMHFISASQVKTIYPTKTSKTNDTDDQDDLCCKFLVWLLSSQQGILVELSIRNVIGERYCSVITEKHHTTN